MKGYDAVVFPREGEPVLICLEPSAEDAARTAWTDDVRLFAGYHPSDPRPPVARATELVQAAIAERGYERIGLELSLGTQASDRMVGEPTTFTHDWFHAFGMDVEDATPLLAQARALKTPQEVERMRLANEIAAAAMEHVRHNLHPGMTESEAGALWEGYVHGEGTGWRGQVELALGFSLVWSGPGIRTFTATTSRPVVEDEPTLFEIWVCADGYWCDHTKNLVLAQPREDYARLETELLAVYEEAISFCKPGASLAELDRLVRAGDSRGRLPGSRPIPSATASARAHTSRRTRTRPAAARSSGDGACDRTRHLLAGRRRPPRRGQLPRHRHGCRSSPFPDGIVSC